MTPGRKFWMRTSARLISSFTLAMSAGFFRSAARLCLLRLIEWKSVLSPSRERLET